MLVYSVIMFFGAALFIGIGIAIYKGSTNLIHGYHQTKVADKAAYGKALGKALFVVAAALLLSGAVGLLGNSDVIAAIALAVLFVGFVIGSGCIVAVQRKYNRGMF